MSPLTLTTAFICGMIQIAKGLQGNGSKSSRFGWVTTCGPSAKVTVRICSSKILRLVQGSFAGASASAMLLAVTGLCGTRWPR